MQDYEEHELEFAGTDWWSRLMALGSLLVAVAALWFAKSNAHSEPLAEPDGQLAALVARLENEADASKNRQAQFSEMMDRFKQVTAYRPTSDSSTLHSELLPQPNDGDQGSKSAGADESDSSDVDDTADEGSSAVSSQGEASVGEDGESESNETVSGIDADLLSETESSTLDASSLGDLLAGESILKALETPQLPVDTGFVTAKVVNESVEPVVITHVKFDPTDVVEDVPTSIAIEPLRETTETELVVGFGADDNTANNPDDQGTYFRRLVSPFTINAGETADILLAIKNPGHIGFGMRGNITLDFNTVESKVISNAVLIFVGRPAVE